MLDPFGISGLEIFTNNLKKLREDNNTEKPKYRRIIVNAIDNRIAQHVEKVNVDPLYTFDCVKAKDRVYLNRGTDYEPCCIAD